MVRGNVDGSPDATGNIEVKVVGSSFVHGYAAEIALMHNFSCKLSETNEFFAAIEFESVPVPQSFRSGKNIGSNSRVQEPLKFLLRKFYLIEGLEMPAKVLLKPIGVSNTRSIGVLELDEGANKALLNLVFVGYRLLIIGGPLIGTLLRKSSRRIYEDISLPMGVFSLG